MNIIITGGGTGGHIYPNLAIADAVFKKKSGHSVLYVGSNEGMEKKLALEHDVPFVAIYCGKLRRYLSLKNLIDFIKIPLGFLQSVLILKRFKPDIIFSKGGYVGVPVVLAGWLLRKRVIIHESDSIPGLATRICSYFADLICLGNEEAKKYFRKKKTIITGIPLREDILKGSKREGLKICGFNEKLPIILIFGGSLGAKFINDLTFLSLKELLKNCQIVHITGKAKSKNAEIHSGENYIFFEEVGDKIAHLYALADLIVSRAGANALAEIQSWGKPSILIPLPKTASRGDQLKNAEILQKKGGCVVLNQASLNKEEFISTILNLLKNSKKLENLKRKAKTELHKNATDKIINLILQPKL